MGDAASLDALPPHTWGRGPVSNLILQLRGKRILQRGAKENMSVKKKCVSFLGYLGPLGYPHPICTASLLELTDRFKTGKGCMAQDPL